MAAPDVKVTDPSRPLQNQIALVTGGSSGIGEGCALALGAAGAAVAVNYLSDAGEAERVVAAIRAGGGEALAIRADVSKETDVQRMVAEAIKRFGTIDILINNAGLQQDAPFHEMSLQQ
jgi:glucose 1-dehydrogenase